MMIRRFQRSRGIATAAAAVLAMAGWSAAARAAESSEQVKERIDKTLAALQTYRMNLDFHEEIVDPRRRLKMVTTSTSEVHHARPGRLSIVCKARVDSNGAITTMDAQIKFDGKREKGRVIMKRGGQTSRDSIVFDQSKTRPKLPFNAWNLQGSGLTPGYDYIGTVRQLRTWDFDHVATTDGVATYRGKMNLELAKRLHPGQNLSHLAKTYTFVEFRVDPKRHVLLGYTMEQKIGPASVKRRCDFKNIVLNEAVADERFELKALPGEQFKDVTQQIVSGWEGR